MLTDLASLAKPRIVALLCLTGTSAVYAAGGASLPTVAAFVVAGALVAGGSAALNCWWDRDLDTRMARTADRPLPSGRLDHRLALAFALGLLAAGTLVGVIALPLPAVVYMLLGVASYVWLYTVWLKRRHPMGVVLGGSAGSFPVLAGWAVVGPVGTEAILFATLVFAWTPAHAWALAYVYREDFRAAEVATLPAVADVDVVTRGVWWSAVATVALLGLFLPSAGPVYAGTAIAGSACFLLAYRAFALAGTESTAVRAFFTSNLLLALVFGAWAVDGVVSTPTWAGAVAAIATAVAFHRLWRARPSLGGIEAAGGLAFRGSIRRALAGAASLAGR